MSNDLKLDRLDRAILSQLQQEGRLSNVELADRVGLTPAPCLRRVKRLEADGVIAGYRAVLDPAKIGRSFDVLVAVDIAATARATVEEFERAVIVFDEVVAARRLFGRPDYQLQVAVADLAAYESFVLELNSLPAVTRTVSIQTMKKLKG
ncbi:MAG: Lrp/AsnC family transcriptional regulator [Nocardioidaceae bacterium]